MPSLFAPLFLCGLPGPLFWRGSPGPIREKASQSGQEEEKSIKFPQGVGIKSCSCVWISEHKTLLVRLDFSRIHWCNMALWRALALLSMMVPAVVSKRQEKPVLSTRMALSHTYNAGYKGGRHLNLGHVAEIKRGAIAKHFWPDYSEVAKAMDEALVKLERRGNIHLPDGYKRARVGWEALAEVRGNITVHLDWVLAHKQSPKRRSTVTKYKKLWLTLGGSPTDLTTAVDNAPLRLCGQGRLEKPTVREKLVVLHPSFGLRVCKQAFLGAGYTHVLGNDLVAARNMGPCIDDVQLLGHCDASTTASRAGKAGAFARHLCQQPEAKSLSIVGPDTQLLAAGPPVAPTCLTRAMGQWASTPALAAVGRGRSKWVMARATTRELQQLGWTPCSQAFAPAFCTGYCAQQPMGAKDGFILGVVWLPKSGAGRQWWC